ncbi:TetR/AcrR family transcriptional regulator [Heyndrickxia vini]|uniref:TetR/AcrR family transcriptional regulator n=1 Tax=Heyndrickxia vini TaxID=1476025 RepID=A0ABX7E4Q1_9BACI|nr:TetR/AcrR family transcriptional regulator [Heyndrickxia vini]QQZ10210.1 TetR/AcrR family transcriptional regulator [Heyndrickxia vini]
MMKKKQHRPLGRPKVKSNDIPRNQLILQTAARLFIDNGYQNVSVDDVALNAGVTKATVYYYFDSKSELYKEAIVSLMNRIKERIDRLMEVNKPLYERLYDVTLAHLEATTSIDIEQFLRESKTDLSNEQIQEMKEAEKKIYESIEYAFSDAVTKGEISSINITFATQAYLALIKVGNYKQQDGSGLFSTAEKSAETILTFFWKGLFGTND